MAYFLYIIECSNGAYYTGYTTNITRRYQEHLSRHAKCKYTRSFPPKKLAAYWEFDVSLSTILSWEKKVKSLSKLEKQALVKLPENIEQLLKTNE